jgi:hypothetical protein
MKIRGREHLAVFYHSAVNFHGGKSEESENKSGLQQWQRVFPFFLGQTRNKYQHLSGHKNLFLNIFKKTIFALCKSK